MLALKKISRVFDPTGVNPENFIPEEVHSFTDIRSRYFALNYGSFFTDSLIVKDLETQRVLEKDVDYMVLHLYLEPTAITGKSVTGIVYVPNELIKDVSCSYQCAGGQYANMFYVIEVIRKLFPDGNKLPVNWNNIIGLPVEFIPTAHMHDIYEFDDWNQLVKALYAVYAAILNRKTRKLKEVYLYLQDKIKDLNKLLDLLDDDLVKTLLTRTMVQAHEWLITDNPTNPANYMRYGNWSIAGRGMMHGEVDESLIGTTFGLASTTPQDYVARTTYHWRLDTDESGFGLRLIRDHQTIREGQSSKIRLQTTGMDGGLQLKYKITGIQSYDIDQPLEGTLTTNNDGYVDFNFTVADDALSEGDEIMRFSVVDWYTFTTVTIVDSSTSMFFDLGFYKNSFGSGTDINLVNEGDTVWLVCKTNNVPTNTTLYLHYIYKNGLYATDFDGALPVSMVVGSGGIANTSIKIKEDYLSEGIEIFGVSISLDGMIENNIMTKWVRINDTSKTANYRIYFASDASGSDTVDTVNEGETVYLIVETQHVPDGSEFSLIYGNSTEVTDFVDGYPNTVTIVNNRAVVPYEVKADNMTEGLERFVVSLFAQNSSVAQASIHIYDTSVGLNGAIGFSATPSVLPNSGLLSIGEGQSLYLIFNMPREYDGNIFNLAYEGSVNSSDFTTVRPNTVTIREGRAVVRYDINSDAAEEGDELFIVRVIEQATLKTIASAQIIIEDTSVAPTYILRYTDSEYSGTDLVSVNEGDIVWLIINASNTKDGDYLYLDWSIGNRTANTANGDVLVNPPQYVQVFGGRAVATISLTSDEITEGDEYLKVDVKRSDAANAEVVATRSILVKDTSRTPSYAVRFNSTINGNGTDLTNQTVLEGTSVYAIIETTNVQDGTSLWLNYVSDSMVVSTPDDFSNVIPSQVTVIANKVVIPFHSIVDWDREHPIVNEEELKINVYTNTQMTIKVAEANIKFIDPTVTVRCSMNSNGNGTIDIINEGQTFYAIVECTNVANGSELPLVITVDNVDLTVANNWLTEDLPEKFVINNNQAIIPIKLKRPNPSDADVNAYVRVKHPGDSMVVNLSQALIKITKV